MHWQEEHKRNARSFADTLKKEGFDFYTGVPCSLLGALIERLSEDRKSPYVPAVREDAAIGMASGAYLAGKKPVVLMQNSGLGYSLNVLTSLNLIYKIPVLCLVSYRGHGPDAPEHLVMGRVLPRLLDVFDVPHRSLALERLDADVGWAAGHVREARTPVALVVGPGLFE